MNLNDLNNKKICILGYGIENKALLKFLIKKKIKCEITICDAKKNIRDFVISNANEKSLRREKNKIIISSRIIIKFKSGKNYDKNLSNFDIIFRVPGYPLFSKEIKKAEKAGAIIYDATNLFFDLCPAKNIIGVTGTKGKGTTSSLIYKILSTYYRAHDSIHKKKVYFGGNIGIPNFKYIDKIKKNDYVVLELSSFQLENLNTSPHIAVITNFSKEHLAPADPNNPNYHKSLKEYKKAKANILKFQKKGDYAILNKKLAASEWKFGKGKNIKFNKSELPSKLIGDYNKENIAAAVEIAKIFKIKNSFIEKTVKNFKGLPHRIEHVITKNGVAYYDNSFATTPESTIKDLDIFKSLILIAGGADKGASFKKLAKKIKTKVKFLVLLKGKGTNNIIKELNIINFPKNKRKTVKSMREAIEISRLHSEKGDTALLSTACASFGMFKNYKERGDLFKKEVMKINK